MHGLKIYKLHDSRAEVKYLKPPKVQGSSWTVSWKTRLVLYINTTSFVLFCTSNIERGFVKKSCDYTNLSY